LIQFCLKLLHIRDECQSGWPSCKTPNGLALFSVRHCGELGTSAFAAPSLFARSKIRAVYVWPASRNHRESRQRRWLIKNITGIVIFVLPFTPWISPYCLPDALLNSGFLISLSNDIPSLYRGFTVDIHIPPTAIQKRDYRRFMVTSFLVKDISSACVCAWFSKSTQMLLINYSS